jgi:hypothetical protein
MSTRILTSSGLYSGAVSAKGLLRSPLPDADHAAVLPGCTALLRVAITETGLGYASPYLLGLVVAASLLPAPIREERP